MSGFPRIALVPLLIGGLVLVALPPATARAQIVPKETVDEDEPVEPDPEPDPEPTVWVSPKGWTLTTVADPLVRSASFELWNGDLSATFELDCSAGGVVGCAGLSASTVSLAPSERDTVTVEYTTPTVGTGHVALVASRRVLDLRTKSSTTVVVDSGYYAVSVRDPSETAPSTVSLHRNNDFNWAREKCLTLPAGQGMVQCGDYVLIHALPAFRTFGKERAPTLIYNSGTAEVRPIIHANVTFPAEGDLPEHFSLALFFNGQHPSNPSSEAFYSTAGYSEDLDEGRRMSVVLAADGTSTGVYPYDVEARAWYGSASHSKSASGELIVVNRRWSPYGAGWWLAGLERLYERPDGDVLVVLGDGSAKRFTSNLDGSYAAPVGEYSTLVANPSEGGWDRVLRRGGRIHFDEAGRHAYTDDPNGNRTTFMYAADAERVEEIYIHATFVSWRLHYGGDGVLDSIVDPAGRATAFTTDGQGRMTRLHHPDGTYRALGYAGGRYVPSSVTDERGNTDDIHYDGLVRPYRIRRPYLKSAAAHPNIYVRSGDVQGASAENTTPAAAIAAVDPTAVADTFIDPRGHRTVYRTNIFREPTFIRDALGHVTRIRRNERSEPTRVRYPNGRVLRLAWDDGRVTELWDSTYAADHGLAGAARTTFVYDDPNCPYELTRMDRELAPGQTLTTSYTYQAPAAEFRGCRLATATDPRGHVTEFAYGLGGRISRITEKDVPVWADRTTGTWGGTRDLHTYFRYHSTFSLFPWHIGRRGNIERITTLHPGRVIDGDRSWPRSAEDTLVTTDFYYDRYGNISRRNDAGGHDVFREFTPRNQLAKVTVRSRPDDPAYDIIYEFEYDEAGNRTHVYTPYHASEDPRPGYQEFVYNALGLLDKQFDEERNVTTYAYDLAGNTAEIRNKNGHTIRYTYDPLNRPLSEMIPAATQPYPYEPDRGGMPERTIPGSTIEWHYNAAGQIDTVRNASGYVAREYYLEGSLRAETQVVGGQPYTFSYAYDLTGRRTEIEYPPAFHTTFETPENPPRTRYEYSATDLLRLTNPIGEVTTFDWDALGRPTLMVQDNDVETRRFYNEAGKLDSLSVTSPTYLHYTSFPEPPGFEYVGLDGADPLVYAVRPIYNADGFVSEDLAGFDARTYAHYMFYDGAHRLLTTEKYFFDCQYDWYVRTATGEFVPIPTFQHCGNYFHNSIVYAAFNWRDYDARGNQVQDDQASIVGLADDEIPPIYHYHDHMATEARKDGHFNDRNQQLASVINFATHEHVWDEVFQEFDRAGNLRLKLDRQLEDNALGGVAFDTTFFYYSADGRLAKSITRMDRRLDVCIFRYEVDYEYDATGRRIRKHIYSTVLRSDPVCEEYRDKEITHEYFYDGDDLLYERITEAWGPDNELHPGETRFIDVLYTRGPSGAAISRHVPQVVLARQDPETGEYTFLKTLFFHLNTQGTPVAASDYTGERYVLPDIRMREYGYESPMAGAGGVSPWIFGFRIWSLEWNGAFEGDRSVSYTGQPYDPETGLHYFRNRYYDGSTGRFTQEDPIGMAGGLNLYAYADNNPINFTDPFGLSGCSIDDPKDCKVFDLWVGWGPGIEGGVKFGPAEARAGAGIRGQVGFSLGGEGVKLEKDLVGRASLQAGTGSTMVGGRGSYSPLSGDRNVQFFAGDGAGSAGPYTDWAVGARAQAGGLAANVTFDAKAAVIMTGSAAMTVIKGFAAYTKQRLSDFINPFKAANPPIEIWEDEDRH